MITKTLRIGEILLREGMITEEYLEEALKAQVIFGGRLGTNLVDLNVLSINDLGRCLAQQRNVPEATAENFMAASARLIEHFPRQLAVKLKVFPLAVEQKVLQLAMLDPQDIRQINEIAFATGLKIKPHVAPELRMLFFLEQHFQLPREKRFLRVRVQGEPEDPRRRYLEATVNVPPNLNELMIDDSPMFSPPPRQTASGYPAVPPHPTAGGHPVVPPRQTASGYPAVPSHPTAGGHPVVPPRQTANGYPVVPHPTESGHLVVPPRQTASGYPAVPPHPTASRPAPSAPQPFASAAVGAELEDDGLVYLDAVSHAPSPPAKAREANPPVDDFEITLDLPPEEPESPSASAPQHTGIDAVLRALAQVTTREEVAALAVRPVLSTATLNVLFLVRGEMAVAQAAHGTSLADEEVQRLVLPLTAGSLLAQAFGSVELVHAPSKSDPLQQVISGYLRAPAPQESCIGVIAVGKRVVNLLCVQRTAGCFDPGEVETIRRLAVEVAGCYARLIRAAKGRAPAE